MGPTMFRSLILIAACASASLRETPACAGELWSTYRGNPQRTGNTDNLPGPASPKVLWVQKSPQHFMAAPVPVGDHLFVSGLGAFDVATFYCLAVDPKAPQRALWTKTVPSLKLPVVSSPAVAGDKLIFGGGMHHLDGGFLHCLRVAGGMPLWELALPGNLVHLEGSPTVVDGRVLIGAGAAGVHCVELERVTLEGKEMDLASIQKLLDVRWKELLAKYEADKKKDPDFAVLPNDDQLPKAAPRRLWQQGQDKWHVDAPVAVAGNRVLVASAYLEQEKVGDRALYCLDRDTGSVLWRTPVKLNPWGGASIAGDLVIVGGSSIGYDPKFLKGARGEVAAYSLADGKERWRKEAPGGVLSCVAVAGDLAVATATDGKVRAFDLATGARRWVYDGKAAFFAPAAVTAGVVYAGDLSGTVHAIDQGSGQGRWTVELATHPDVKSPGMIYAGLVVHGGRVFVATCNLAGPHANQPCVVVCLGDK